jgi:hypothetical protein
MPVLLKVDDLCGISSSREKMLPGMSMTRFPAGLYHVGTGFGAVFGSEDY